MYLGCYYDDNFQHPLLTRHHAISVSIERAKHTLNTVLQYEALDGHIANYMDEDQLHVRYAASTHISSFRVTATLQYSLLRCVPINQLASKCVLLQQSPSASTFQLCATTSFPIHPVTKSLPLHFIHDLDDLDKLSADFS